MKTGSVGQLGKGETITCTRSASDGGGRFCFELRLEPGVEGPPMHSHAEGPEVVEVISGAVTFYFADGPKVLLRAGDRLEIAAGRVHTFKNSKTGVLVARGEHGPRFERAVDQHVAGGPAFTRLCRYLVEIDPHATYMASRVVRAVMRSVALVGRLRGIQPA